MPRPRLPTAVLELKGAYKVNPGRRTARANEPVVAGEIGGPPAHLEGPPAALWRDLAGYSTWLTSADRLMLEIACVLFARFRAGELDGSGASKLISALSKLGFTPTDRSRVHAPGGKEPTEDPYAEFG